MAHAPTEKDPLVAMSAPAALPRVLAAMRLAARRAAALAASLQGRAPAISKADLSPVTVADFACQALISTTLHAELGLAPAAFRMVAEEDAAALEGAAGAPLLELVVAALNVAAAPPPVWTPAIVLAALSTGRYAGGGAAAHFMVDPIDGTKGFLRPRGHYAVGLAFLSRGAPVLAAIACPNLPFPAWREGDGGSDAERGTLFCAQAGAGATMEALLLPGSAQAAVATAEPPPPTTIRTSAAQEGAAPVLAESFEAGHSDHAASALVAAALGMGARAIRIDSMSKYGLLARGDAHLYLRFPSASRAECAWDHAPGSLILTEAGGAVSDARGLPLDFSRGRSLSANYGVVAAASPALHTRAVAAAGEAMAKTGK